MHNLDSLLRPKSIAIVGASESSWYGQLVLKNLQTCGFNGTIFPVNPRYEEVMGMQCYPSLSAIPGKVDCAVLTISCYLFISISRILPLF